VSAFHPMSCDDVDDYDRLIAWLPALDLVHLGLGPDGHTASLFPGSAGLEAKPGRMAIINTDPTGLNPHQRMTLTFAAIARARLVVFTSPASPSATPGATESGSRPPGQPHQRCRGHVDRGHEAAGE